MGNFLHTLQVIDKMSDKLTFLAIDHYLFYNLFHNLWTTLNFYDLGLWSVSFSFNIMVVALILEVSVHGLLIRRKLFMK